MDVPEGSRPPYRHGNLKEELLREALAVLALSGGSAVSLRALARRLGVSSGAPYRHYPDRETLLRALVRRGFTDLAVAAARADAGAAPGAAIAAQAIAYVRFARGNPALLRLMFGALRFDPAVAPTAEAAFEVLAGRMRRDRPDDPLLESRLLAAWSLMHGLAMLSVDGQISDKGPIETVVAGVFEAAGLTT